MSMSNLDIRITGPQGSGKTSLLKLLATGLGHLGKVQQYQNEKDERATVTVNDPVQLARFVEFDTDLERLRTPFRAKQIGYTPDAEKLCERVRELLHEHGLRVDKIDNNQLNIGRKAEVCLLDVIHRLKDEDALS